MSYEDDAPQTVPDTTTVFDQAPIHVDSHDWQQQGYFMTDACDPKQPNCYSGGLPMPQGSLLVKEKGSYRIVDEITRLSV